jgi:hypothetical protein
MKKISFRIAAAIALCAAGFLLNGCDNAIDSLSKSKFAVTIDGDFNVGGTLTAKVELPDGVQLTEDGFTYQWFRGENTETGEKAAQGNGINWIAIAGATTKTYKLTKADEGKYITVSVTVPGYGVSEPSIDGSNDKDVVAPTKEEETGTEDGETGETNDGTGQLSISYKDFLIDAVTGLPANDDTVNAAGKTVATLTMPAKDGPWTPQLVEGLDDNHLFEIVPITPEGSYEIRIKNEALSICPYMISVNMTNQAGKVFYRTIDFSVTNTPPPFKNAPQVYPHITGVGKNKLVVSWNELPRSASGYCLYIGTSNDSASAIPYTDNVTTTSGENTVEITDISDDAVEGGLPDGTTYYVWLRPWNAEGEGAFGAYAERTTSAALWPAFYQDTDGKPFFSWDSYSGDGGTGKGGVDFYIISPPNEKRPIGRMQYAGKTGYKGDIVYHATGDMTRKSKWGEPLSGPNGVLIIKYDSRNELIIPGDYQAVYYYGLDSVQTKGPESGNTFGPNKNPLGLNLCYFGNSYDLAKSANPETKTLEQAIDKFTLKNVSKYIAWVAVPWYRRYDAYIRDYDAGTNNIEKDE